MDEYDMSGDVGEFPVYNEQGELVEDDSVEGYK